LAEKSFDSGRRTSPISLRIPPSAPVPCAGLTPAKHTNYVAVLRLKK
jgi:hypothetical protein